MRVEEVAQRLGTNDVLNLQRCRVYHADKEEDGRQRLWLMYRSGCDGDDESAAVILNGQA